jgi:hypothetical protein
MGLEADLEAALRQAMRAGQTERVSVVRLLLAAIKNRQIEKGRKAPLTDAELLEVVMGAGKQRREAIELYRKGARPELAEKEARELDILSEFLPAPLSAGELDAKITEALTATHAAGLKDMGKVMKLLMPQVVGRVDGAQLSERVKARLSQLAAAG